MPSVRCLILTSYGDDDALFAAVMAGHPATCSNRLVVRMSSAGIRIVAQGKSLIDPSLTGKLLSRLRNPPATTRERRISLTNRQIGEWLYLAAKP